MFTDPVSNVHRINAWKKILLPIGVTFYEEFLTHSLATAVGTFHKILFSPHRPSGISTQITRSEGRHKLLRKLLVVKLFQTNNRILGVPCLYHPTGLANSKMNTQSSVRKFGRWNNVVWWPVEDRSESRASTSYLRPNVNFAPVS